MGIGSWSKFSQSPFFTTSGDRSFVFPRVGALGFVGLNGGDNPTLLSFGHAVDLFNVLVESNSMMVSI